MTLFLLGTIFGALLMFMARIMDYHVETVVKRYKKNDGSFKKRTPIIVQPNDPTQELMDEISS